MQLILNCDWSGTMKAMNTSAPVLPPGLSMLPADLSRGQRAWLMAAVGLAHVVVAYVVLTRSEHPIKVDEPPSIEVALISETPVASPMVPSPAPPVKQEKAPAPVANPVRTPQPSAPPVLASTRPAQANEIQAPAPAPVVDTKSAAPTVPAAPAVTAPTALAAPATEAARPPAQPLVLPSSALRYLVEPKLNYPRVSRELGESGVVKLRVLIDEQGHPNSNVTVAQSSGFPRLDQEAVRAMRAARFQPRIVDGVPRAVSTTASLEFNLEEQ
jgi:protein TonB